VPQNGIPDEKITEAIFAFVVAGIFAERQEDER
jgi:hypothetical protein